MEIKKVNNEIINEYPKMTEFNKKDLKKYLPNKWLKIGISSFVFGLLMKATKSNAINTIELGGIIDATPTAGVVQIDPTYQLLNAGTEIFKVLSIFLLILSVILTPIKKYKNKKEKTTKLTNKKMRILYIVTGISIIISIILMILQNYFLYH